MLQGGSPFSFASSAQFDYMFVCTQTSNNAYTAHTHVALSSLDLLRLKFSCLHYRTAWILASQLEIVIGVFLLRHFCLGDLFDGCKPYLVNLFYDCQYNSYNL